MAHLHLAAPRAARAPQSQDVRAVHRPRAATPARGAAAAAGVADPIGRLTPRQREVLQLVAEGRSAKEVANILNISPRTAEFHKYRLMEQLAVTTNAELVQYAMRYGLVAPQ